MMRRSEGTGLRRTLRVARGAARAMSVLGIIGLAGGLVAASLRPQVYLTGTGFVSLGRNPIEVFRLSVLLGALGGSLAFGVLVLAVRGVFWRSGPTRMDRWLVVGLTGVIAFAGGALALSAVGPSLVEAYVDAPTPADAATVVGNAASLIGLAVGFAWQTLGVLAVGLWWFLLARLLPVGERATRIIGFSIAATAVVTTATHLASLDLIAGITLGVFFVLVIVAGFVVRGTFARIRDVIDEAGVPDAPTEDDDEDDEEVEVPDDLSSLDET